MEKLVGLVVFLQILTGNVTSGTTGLVFCVMVFVEEIAEQLFSVTFTAQSPAAAFVFVEEVVAVP